MTSPAPETLERDDFVSDREVARRWRVSYKTARRAIKAMPGFPDRWPEFGGKRRWSAIQRYMRIRDGAMVSEPGQPQVRENWNA